VSAEGPLQKRLTVLGHPVAHSRSPAMHNAALAELGMAGEWSYEAPIDVAPEDFERKVRELAAADFAGVNVTVPHKEAALRLADTASPEAEAIGAANTLVFSAVRVEAHNTDAGGLLAALPGSLRTRRALVLGAGGAARAAIWALARSGAALDAGSAPPEGADGGIEPIEVDVWNRTGQRAAAVAARLGGRPVACFEPSDYGLIVNATAVGLHGEDPFEHLPLRPGSFREQVVVDMVYGDRPSKLIEVARAEGADTVDGIEVLVRQGAISFQIWTGRKPPLDAMRAAARGRALDDD
jgi:shikimate dehydrogenase